MPDRLSKDALARAIDACTALSLSLRRLGSGTLTADYIDNASGHTGADERATFVRNVVDRFRFEIQPDYYNRLVATTLHVPSLPICNAVADPAERTIIVFEGLLQAAAFRLECALLIAEVGRWRASTRDKCWLSEQQYKACSFRATVLPIHFMRTGSPLPSITSRLTPELQRDAFIGFGGMLLFILFHELGHLELGHGVAQDRGTTSLPPAMACPEVMNAYKSNEFEADEFAFRAMVPEARGAFLVNAWSALKMFSDYETLSGIGGPMHPLIVNRMARLSALAGVTEDTGIECAANALLRADANLLNTHLKRKHSSEDDLPASVIVRLHEEAFSRTLDDEAACRDALDVLFEAYDAIPPR